MSFPNPDPNSRRQRMSARRKLKNATSRRHPLVSESPENFSRQHSPSAPASAVPRVGTNHDRRSGVKLFDRHASLASFAPADRDTTRGQGSRTAKAQAARLPES